MTRQFNFPRDYLPPTGGPLYWRNEKTGVLGVAVMSYLEKNADEFSLDLLAAYLEYWIDAPCWDFPGNIIADTLSDLRAEARRMKTWNEIHNWLMKALDIGIDPL